MNGELRLSAPTLIIFETLNALKYSGLYNNRELGEIASAIDGYGLALHALKGRVADLAIDAAYKNDITIYDSAYLGLASFLGTKFVTADRKLAGRLATEYAGITQLLETAG